MATHNPPDVPERRHDESAVGRGGDGLDRAVLVDEGETPRRGHRGAVALVGEASPQRENSDRPAGGERPHPRTPLPREALVAPAGALIVRLDSYSWHERHSQSYLRT